MRRSCAVWNLWVKVRGTRWAMGRDIAGGIQVVPAQEEEANGND